MFGMLSLEELEKEAEEWKVDIKENIVFHLENTEENRAFLNVVPHRPFHDLSITYKWDFRDSSGKIIEWSPLPCGVITNEQMEELGLTEEALYQLALENTKRHYKPEILPVREILNNADMQELDMWVATNNLMFHGSCALLYEELFHELAEQEKTNFYIFPLTNHEVILMPEGNMAGIRPEELADTVICALGMDPEEHFVCRLGNQSWLSSQVYFYDREAREITQITHTEGRLMAGLALADHLSEAQELEVSYSNIRKTSR